MPSMIFQDLLIANNCLRMTKWQKSVMKVYVPYYLLCSLINLCSVVTLCLMEQSYGQANIMPVTFEVPWHGCQVPTGLSLISRIPLDLRFHAQCVSFSHKLSVVPEHFWQVYLALLLWHSVCAVCCWVSKQSQAWLAFCAIVYVLTLGSSFSQL